MSRSVSLSGKVIAVTGGARGIGLAIASVLQGLGAKVAVGDIDESALAEAGGRLGLDSYSRLDVTDQQSFIDFLDGVERHLGTIDVLVNNAGIAAVGRAIDEPDDVTQRVLAVNAYGSLAIPADGRSTALTCCGHHSSGELNVGGSPTPPSPRGPPARSRRGTCAPTCPTAPANRHVVTAIRRATPWGRWATPTA